MKDLRPIRGLHRLLELISQGEHEHQDFKYLISDARKIARSISAFANNDGGRLIIGVKDNGIIAGVRSEEDLYMIEQAASRYCRPEVEVAFTAIKAGAGMVVYIASIAKVSDRPVVVDEGGGVLQAYYRVHDENIVAHPLMVKAWLMMSAAGGTVLRLSDAETHVLHYVSEHNGISEHDIAVGCHLSQATTDTSIVRLASLGLLQFTYDGHRFLIHIP